MPLAGSIQSYAPLYANQDGYNARYAGALTIGTGNKTFSVQPAKSYGIGSCVRIYNATDKWMLGDVTAYDPVSGVLSINVTTTKGTGSFSDWYIVPSGPQGDTGPKGDNSLGTGGVAITTDATLTTANAFVVVNPATAGVYLTLPAGTSMPSKVSSAFHIVNTGDYDVGIKDSTGAKVGWIRPQTGCVIGCSDNTTAAGSWSGDNLKSTGVTAKIFDTNYATSAAAAGFSTDMSAKYDLDNGHELIVYAINGQSLVTIYSILYHHPTKTVKDTRTIGSGNWAAYERGPDNNSVVVAIVTNSSATITVKSISVNTTTSAVSVGSSNITSQNNVSVLTTGNAQPINMLRVSVSGSTATYAFTFNYSGSGIAIVAFTVSITSNVATFNTTATPTQMGYSAATSGFSANYKRIYAISPTQIVLAAASDTNIFYTPLTVSGVTLVAGTNASSPSQSATPEATKFCTQLADGRIPVIYGYNSQELLVLLNVAGNTVTFSNVLVLGSSGYTQLYTKDFVCAPNGSLFWIVYLGVSSPNTIHLVQYNAAGSLASALSFYGTSITVAINGTSRGGAGCILPGATNTSMRFSSAGRMFTVTASGSVLTATDLVYHPTAATPSPPNGLGIRDYKTLVSSKTKNMYFYGPGGSYENVVYANKTIFKTDALGSVNVSGCVHPSEAQDTAWVIGQNYLEKVECV